MNTNRRSFVHTALAAPFVGWMLGTFGRLSSAPQNPQVPRSQPPFPGPPENPFPDNTPKVDPKTILKHNQQQIQDDVLKLYDLARQLKEQVGKTDSTSVLSLPLVQKAEEIEKLAKQIKTLARGS